MCRACRKSVVTLYRMFSFFFICGNKFCVHWRSIANYVVEFRESAVRQHLTCNVGRRKIMGLSPSRHKIGNEYLFAAAFLQGFLHTRHKQVRNDGRIRISRTKDDKICCAYSFVCLFKETRFWLEEKTLDTKITIVLGNINVRLSHYFCTVFKDCV